MADDIKNNTSTESQNPSTVSENTKQLSADEKLQKERDEYLDGWKRAKADLINYKKDEVKRFESMIAFASEALIRELVPVLDSFDLALESLGGESKVEKGLYLIKAQLEDALKKHGLEKIKVSVGDVFDPSVHEAVVSVPCEKPSGTVVEEVDRGYMLSGKMIRPARVKVAQ